MRASVAMAAFMAVVPPLACSGADLSNWAATFAATVDVARAECSDHYLVRMKEAAKLLAGLHPRVDPDDTEVRRVRELHRARLKKYFDGRSKKEVCKRLHEALGPKSNLVKDHKLKAIMVIRPYVGEDE